MMFAFIGGGPAPNGPPPDSDLLFFILWLICLILVAVTGCLMVFDEPRERKTLPEIDDKAIQQLIDAAGRKPWQY